MKTKRYYLRGEFWAGVIVLIAGILHLLNKLDISFTGVLENYWPILFIAIGIFQISSARYRDAVSSTLLILVGTMLMVFKSGVLTSETLQEYWPEPLKKIIEVLIQSVAYMIDFY